MAWFAVLSSRCLAVGWPGGAAMSCRAGHGRSSGWRRSARHLRSVGVTGGGLVARRERGKRTVVYLVGQGRLESFEARDHGAAVLMR